MNAGYLEAQLLSIMSDIDILSKVILIVLGIFSIITWMIIFDKIFKFRLLGAKTKRFIKDFWSGIPIYDVYQKYKDDIECQSALIFTAAMEEWNNIKGSDIGDANIILDRLYDTIMIANNRSMVKIKSGLTFVYIVASTATLFGLLGTVWGVSQSFKAISIMKEATLVALAPGINSALVTTIVGLITAINALITYNILRAKIISIEIELNNFSLELIGILSKEMEKLDV